MSYTLYTSLAILGGCACCYAGCFYLLCSKTYLEEVAERKKPKTGKSWRVSVCWFIHSKVQKLAQLTGRQYLKASKAHGKRLRQQARNRRQAKNLF